MLLPADFVTRIQTGQAKAFLWGHGGSMRDPYATLDNLYHIRHVKPTGESHDVALGRARCPGWGCRRAR